MLDHRCNPRVSSRSMTIHGSPGLPGPSRVYADETPPSFVVTGKELGMKEIDVIFLFFF